MPGVIFGLIAGVTAGIVLWDYAAQQEAMNPLEDLSVPTGRLDLPTIRSTVDGLARSYLGEDGNVGLAIGLIRGDESAVWCYGRRTLSDAQPPDGDTLFELASVGKTFTGLLLAVEHRSAKLEWNDSLQQHLPANANVPAFDGRAITLLHLATQTSGLPSLPPDFQFGDPLNPYKDYTTAMMFADLAKIKLPRAPGSAYEYSNFGFGLLGEALSRANGNSYENVVIERICTPLGMNRTRMTLTEDLRANLATPHDAGKPVPVWEDTTMPGAGSFHSTANDMVRYLKLYVRPAADTPKTLVQSASETTIKRRPADMPSRSVGLAWHIDSENAHNIVWHNGGVGGSCSYAAFAVKSGCGVAVFSNSNNSVDELGRKVLYLLLQEDP